MGVRDFYIVIVLDIEMRQEIAECFLVEQVQENRRFYSSFL